MKKVIKDYLEKTWNAIATSLKTAIAEAPPEVRRASKKFLLGALGILVVLILVKWGRVKYEERVRAAEIAAGPQVKTAKIVTSPGEHTINLIGETRPWQEATLYAKVSGYLKAVKVDKGDHVKSGQVLAVIESPETDQGYAGAFAENKNKQAISTRMNTLLAKHLVSQQEADQAQADADVSAARFHTEETLKSYETLRAPFTGTVTARYADPGALVQNAMNSQASSLPVVTVSTIDRLRVDVFVDQHDALYVEKDETVEITLTDRPDLKIQGTVSRVSGELDPRTKMLLTEIDLKNDDHRLVAGSFVQVALHIKSPPYVEAPVESLVMRNEKPFLTVVAKDNTITFKPVEIANNDGKMLWISGGIQAGELVALSIMDTVPEGGKVRPVVEETPVAGGKK